MFNTTYRDGNSKSFNARLAESEGRYPATAMAARLRSLGLFKGVTAADILSAVSTGEWHHTGSYAARTNYYGLADVFASRQELRAAIVARRGRSQPAGERHEGCKVEWLEWSGSRRHPHASTRAAECAVTVKGDWYTLHLPAGDVRKNKTTRGFKVVFADGSSVKFGCRWPAKED
jgi:hypothetical protein